MKSKKNKKKIAIIISAIFIIILLLLIVFVNKSEKMTLVCNGIKSDEQAKLTTSMLIEKTSKQIHFNYNGEVQFFTEDETIKAILKTYIQTQVSKMEEIDGVASNFEELENNFTYAFDFNMSSLTEEQLMGLLGISSQNMEKLKKHFENGGFVCEEI